MICLNPDNVNNALINFYIVGAVILIFFLLLIIFGKHKT